MSPAGTPDCPTPLLTLENPSLDQLDGYVSGEEETQDEADPEPAEEVLQERAHLAFTFLTVFGLVFSKILPLQ